MLSPSTTFRREGRNFVLLRQIYRLVSPSPFLPPPPLRLLQVRDRRSYKRGRHSYSRSAAQLQIETSIVNLLKENRTWSTRKLSEQRSSKPISLYAGQSSNNRFPDAAVLPLFSSNIPVHFTLRWRAKFSQQWPNYECNIERKSYFNED